MQNFGGSLENALGICFDASVDGDALRRSWRDSGGHHWFNPIQWVRGRSFTLSRELTVVEHHHVKAAPEAWRSWGLAVRYLIVRLADAATYALLVLLAYVRR